MIIMPKKFMAGIIALTGLSAFLTLFGSAVTENTANGVSAYYLSFAVCGVIIAVLWKRFNIAPLRSASVMVAISAVGFVLAIISLHVPSLSLAACAALGTSMAVCDLGIYLVTVVLRRYPSRFVMPVFLAVALTALMVHSWLLEAFRNNLQILYILYLVIAVTLTFVYLMMEPYLLYSFRSRTLEDIIGIVAEEIERPPLLRTALKTEPALSKEEPPHQRRMKILMAHSLEPLTRREYQLADCIMRGLRRAEIAQEMDILPETVTKYTNRIYDKFDIHRRQDLFKLAEKLERFNAD
jgi:DNA-binding CsgD family transcriptional regulator